MTRSIRSALVLLVGSAAAAACAPGAVAAPASAFQATARPDRVYAPAPPAGAQVLRYRFGPLKVEPGQNTIAIDVQRQRPAVNGWIVGFKPGLIDAATGRSPSVDVVHLHHAVWVVGEKGGPLRPTFAVGEEKTNFIAPPGFGWRYRTDQTWLINHMIHDLVGAAHEVYVTYTLWFIPDSAPQAAGITAEHTQWMDVEGAKTYPVFNARRGTGGRDRRLTFPTEDPAAYPDGIVRNRWVVDHDATLVQTAGHLHPGGLHTDLTITRGGRTVTLFRSRAHYYEPAGAVSWDVAMTATKPTWRIAVKAGDILTTTATYDTSRASWYEVMGIMVLGMTDGPKGGIDPFAKRPDTSGWLTHGRLRENIDTGVGRPNPGLTDPVRLRNGPVRDTVVIRNFGFDQGDLSRRGVAGRPATVVQGAPLTFVNRDDPLTVRYHTITACRTPCNRTGGIRFPLVDAPRIFDSGELGFGPAGANLYGGPAIPYSAVIDVPAPAERCAGAGGLVRIVATACIGSDTWSTPADLRPGTYTYFCRVHPFMRGAFRVVPARRASTA